MNVISANRGVTKATEAFNQSTIDYFRSLAGPEFTWDIIRGSRPSSQGYRKGLRLWLYTYQNSLCVFCGEYERVQYMEMCHIVPRHGIDAGYLPGNIGLGCRTCNESHGTRVLSMCDIKLSHLIAMAWPSRGECEAVARLAR